MREIDNFYMQKDEPVRSCLITLREAILARDSEISEVWKYHMPFFIFKGKRICYLWVEKKTNLPYIGIVNGYKIDHPELIQDGRSRMKIIKFNPLLDLPILTIHQILDAAML